MRVFVIAEAGISHDGDIDKAFSMIDQAVLAGADAVKFQTFNAAKLAKRRGKPELAETLKPYEMPLTWLPQLHGRCCQRGIEFMTTCFDEETLKIVAPFVSRFKIGHGESEDKAFVEEHLDHYHKKLIISVTGGFNPYPADYLYCTPKYPTHVNEVRLCDIYNKGCDGFSDHTRDERTGGLAVAAGAKIVEVHFRDWYTKPSNPDWCVSHDPSGLIRYVEFIRHAERAVYGVDEEETKRLEPPQSVRHSDHRPGVVESAPPVDPLGGLF